jgi:hypothetical protein
MRTQRPRWWFTIAVNRYGQVIRFSKMILYEGSPCPIFHIRHHQVATTSTGEWSAEIVDPRIAPEHIYGIHLRQVAWRCGYTESETGEITKLVKLFSVIRPKRKQIAGILGVPKDRIRISRTIRRE